MDPIHSSNLALIDGVRVNDERVRAERWLATLAHELRDPLSAIIMSLDELRQVCGGEASASQTRQIAMDSAVHMSKVIEDVLDLCRTHTAKPAIGTETVDLSRIVIAAVRCAHLQMARRRHHLSVSLQPSNLMIRAHPSRLQQILTNLLVNAAKYTAPSGEIALDVQALEDVLVISVRDNGVGMVPAFVGGV
jgi:signal transduction histidine kinase